MARCFLVLKPLLWTNSICKSLFHFELFISVTDLSHWTAWVLALMWLKCLSKCWTVVWVWSSIVPWAFTCSYSGSFCFLNTAVLFDLIHPIYNIINFVEHFLYSEHWVSWSIILLLLQIFDIDKVFYLRWCLVNRRNRLLNFALNIGIFLVCFLFCFFLFLFVIYRFLIGL